MREEAPLTEYEEKSLDVLSKILAQIQWQTTLMENVFLKKDATNHQNQNLRKNMEGLIDDIKNLPGMQQPQAAQLLDRIMGMIPK
jgi:hypothetical protein